MTWKLFLDDQRMPADAGFYTGNKLFFDYIFVIARSSREAKELIEERGCPEFISFDHDLADAHYAGDFSGEETGYNFAHWLIYKDIANRGKFIPKDFGYVVHSMNPVGKENIEKLLESYLAFRSDDNCKKQCEI